MKQPPAPNASDRPRKFVGWPRRYESDAGDLQAELTRTYEQADQTWIDATAAQGGALVQMAGHAADFTMDMAGHSKAPGVATVAGFYNAAKNTIEAEAAARDGNTSTALAKGASAALGLAKTGDALLGGESSIPKVLDLAVKGAGAIDNAAEEKWAAALWGAGSVVDPTGAVSATKSIVTAGLGIAEDAQTIAEMNRLKDASEAQVAATEARLVPAIQENNATAAQLNAVAAGLVTGDWILIPNPTPAPAATGGDSGRGSASDRALLVP